MHHGNNISTVCAKEALKFDPVFQVSAERFHPFTFQRRSKGKLS